MSYKLIELENRIFTLEQKLAKLEMQIEHKIQITDNNTIHLNTVRMLRTRKTQYMCEYRRNRHIPTN